MRQRQEGQQAEHLVFASTSSVYGANTKMPFSVHQNVDHPLTLYAATKKANELMAHTYAHLYGLPVTGLRFFTVYGPWGRPDMALFLFTRNILAGQPIDVFNFGHHRRDFTFMTTSPRASRSIGPRRATRRGAATRWIPARARLLIGSTTSATTARRCDTRAARGLPRPQGAEEPLLQPGDVPDTWADIDDPMSVTRQRRRSRSACADCRLVRRLPSRRRRRREVAISGRAS